MGIWEQEPHPLHWAQHPDSEVFDEGTHCKDLLLLQPLISLVLSHWVPTAPSPGEVGP